MSARHASVVVSVLVLALSTASSATAVAGFLTDNCVVGNSPAATLLFPYFEVDLADPSGRTTLLSIGTVAGAPPWLARVTLWTEWGIPSFAFNLYLSGADIQTINLRDIFLGGRAPTTGPGADAFPGCNPTLGAAIAIPLLQGTHTGAKIFDACYSQGAQGPTVATGYVTVDAALRCPAPDGGGAPTPASGSSYFWGASAIAATSANANVLWGDWYLVTPGEAFATGFSAIGIHADPEYFGLGDYTFYGRFLSFKGDDRRRPLPSTYYHRFLRGGVFSGSTQIFVWRDTRRATVHPASCPNPTDTCASAACEPDWMPLGEDLIVAFDEAGHSTLFDNTDYFGLATQRVDVAVIPQGNSFGFLRLDLDRANGLPSQAWVGYEARASGLFAVGIEGTPVDDMCDREP